MVHVFTVGHSTRSLDEFRAILAAHGIETLVDVRTIPKSRRHPHFSSEALARTLAPVRYVHMRPLGGLRHAKKDSKNLAWRNESFRGYADYMETPAFKQALDELIDLASVSNVAVMCAEAVPWKCHRSLLSDALVAHGVAVDHILAVDKDSPHKLTPFARVEGEDVSYPALV